MAKVAKGVKRREAAACRPASAPASTASYAGRCARHGSVPWRGCARHGGWRAKKPGATRSPPFSVSASSAPAAVEKGLSCRASTVMLVAARQPFVSGISRFWFVQQLKEQITEGDGSGLRRGAYYRSLSRWATNSVMVRAGWRLSSERPVFRRASGA